MSSVSTDIVDIWVNLVTEQGAAQFLGQESNANIPSYLGGTGTSGLGAAQLVERMDSLGVATGILTPGLTRDGVDRKSTRLNSSHTMTSRMPSSA